MKKNIRSIIIVILSLIIILLVVERVTLKNRQEYENSPFWSRVVNDNIIEDEQSAARKKQEDEQADAKNEQTED